MVQRGKVTCPELVNARVNLKPGLETFTILISAGALKRVVYCLFLSSWDFSPLILKLIQFCRSLLRPC